MDCVPDNDPYVSLDPTPETPAKKDALEKAGEDLAAACERNSGDILPYVSTQSSARDMDRIRAALGESKISYFGFSYGSELGAEWTTLFPATVRAAVLDGASNPDDTPAQLAIAAGQGIRAGLHPLPRSLQGRLEVPVQQRGQSRRGVRQVVRVRSTTARFLPRKGGRR